jgi:outer membrane protein OmpA-like peptidoglycan-associated protein
VRPLATLTFVCASTALLAQAAAIEPPLPTPLPGSRLISSRTIGEPLELTQATAEDEAVIAGQSYVQHTYDAPNHITAIVFLQAFRDALFASGWKLIHVTTLDAIALQPETVNVAAHYREHGRNIYARFTQEPGKPYQINVAEVGAEDWVSQLAKECRVTIHSIHFAHDRPEIKLLESEPTLRKLARLITAAKTPAVEVQGHVDNIGEAAAPAREMLSLSRARSVATWLTTHGGVPAKQVTARGVGKSRPIADNDTDLGRALNRRIEVVRPDCGR